MIRFVNSEHEDGCVDLKKSGGRKLMGGYLGNDRYVGVLLYALNTLCLYSTIHSFNMALPGSLTNWARIVRCRPTLFLKSITWSKKL